MNTNNAKIGTINEGEYDIWLTKLYGRFKLSRWAVSISFGVIIFLIGLMASYSINFHYVYVRSSLVYLMLLGIVWVSACISWGMDNYINSLNKIRFNFAISNEDFNKICTKWLRFIYNDRLILIFFFFFMIITFILIYVAYTSQNELMMVFPLEWYAPPIIPKITIMTFYLALVVLLITTSSLSIIFNILLLNELGKQSVNFHPNITNNLAPICNFNLKVSITWFIANFLIVVAVFNRYGNFNFFIKQEFFLLCEMIVIVIGLTTFFAPQYSLHRTLKKAKDNLIQQIDDIYELQYKSVMDIKESEKDFASAFVSLNQLQEVRYNIDTKTKTWLYDFNTIVKLLCSVAINVIVVYSNLINTIFGKI